MNRYMWRVDDPKGVEGRNSIFQNTYHFPVPFRRARLLRVVPENHVQLLYLHKMLDESPYDFWREPRKIGKYQGRY